MAVIPGNQHFRLSPRRLSPRWAVFTVAVLGLFGVSLWLRASAPARGGPVRIAARPSSIAVLPFTNTSPDPSDDYLGPGIAAELTRQLTRFTTLRVAPQSSAFALDERYGDPRITGRRLNVGTLLQGSVRRSEGRIRVTARLVDVNEGFDLWSETYDRSPSDIFAIEAEIRQALAGTFHLRLLPDFGSGPATASLPAYHAYLAGTYLLGGRAPGDGARAIAELTHAIDLDSNFARAHAALAEAYLRRDDADAPPPLVVMPMAKAAALRALALDSTLADPHTTLGTVRFEYERDWRGAEAELRRAIALGPDAPDSYIAYSRLLLATGRMDESLVASQRAVALSPLAPAPARNLGWHYLHARQYDRARGAIARAIELDSTAWRPRLDLALLEQVAGNYTEAEAQLRIPLPADPERAELETALGQVYAGAGRTEEARAVLQSLQDAAQRRYISPYFIACLQAWLGQRSPAFASLNQAVRERSEPVAYLRIDPRVDSLRTDPRFARLLRQVRLP